MTIQRGATYKYPIQIKIKSEVLPLDSIQKIEFSFGNYLIKEYPKDDSIEREENILTISLSEEDTLSLPVTNNLRLQLRVTFHDGSIKFTKSRPIIVVDTQFSGVE